VRFRGPAVLSNSTELSGSQPACTECQAPNRHAPNASYEFITWELTTQASHMHTQLQAAFLHLKLVPSDKRDVDNHTLEENFSCPPGINAGPADVAMVLAGGTSRAKAVIRASQPLRAPQLL